jgi:hypothetical protein
MSFCIDLMIL